MSWTGLHGFRVGRVRQPEAPGLIALSAAIRRLSDGYPAAASEMAKGTAKIMAEDPEFSATRFFQRCGLDEFGDHRT